MAYDHESNLLSIELSSGKIDHAIEIGNFIFHLSKEKKPILLEILDASNLIGKFEKNEEKNILNNLKKIIPNINN